MLKSLFLPFGKSERGALLRLCGKLYLVQLGYIILGIHLTNFLAFQNISLAKLVASVFMFGLVLVFPYLHICAYAKRLESLSYNRLLLIAIGAALYFTVYLTGLLGDKIILEGLFTNMGSAYVMATLKLSVDMGMMFSGYLIISFGVAYLPEPKRPSSINVT